MTTSRASAPGKLFLSGEYAVLEGAPAVVTAIDRRAIATAAGEPGRESPVLAAVRAQVARHRDGDGDGPRRWPGLRADSSSFKAGDGKFGLGSSAAVAAAATGALFEWSGRPIDADREAILALATAAHRDAQGGRGSGADVAAAVRGGTIVFTRAQPPEAIELAGVTLAFVWSGHPASTVALIERVAGLARRAPDEHRALLRELTGIATELAAAYRRGDGPAIVAATAVYGATLDRLGRAAGAPIVTSAHQRIAKMARRVGGAAKPSGAGGGDMAVAAFADPEACATFVDRCREQRLQPIDLVPGAPGLAAVAGL